MAWFRRQTAPLAPRSAESRVPEGVWVKCGSCKEILYRKDVLKNLSVCPKCAFHFRIGARERLDMLFDGSWEEFDHGLVSSDPLGFEDARPYADRLRAGKAKTNSFDALVSAVGEMGGRRAIVGAMEYAFIGGSMGVVVGEKVTRCIERALAERLPLIVVSCSGGARMMEGTLSLMQMAKISAALARLHEARLPFVSILTDPTTGGVTASYAMLGDLNVAEPGALIGFAGPRVIEQTIRQKLPAGFQRSEFLLEHGMLDMVTDRRELKETLVRCLPFFMD
ncbi:MAG: acetyl-CoA carboxylase, carboxyltransferase subunit beta [Acidobacteria bacterium]|jgi:acetyl-CoA carboxylase carboxyl transferase subunit beta|nr:acetyl-CoA carboxylase, carboxyltransferase subunit beta [Acidobacteriota bacterium]